MKQFITTLLFLLFAGSLMYCNAPKKTAEEAPKRNPAVAAMLETRQFQFLAETMFPTGFRSRILDPGYSVRVDSPYLVSYLPYIGRATSAMAAYGDAGMNFTSRNFTMTIADGRRNSWDITLKPHDNTDVRVITMNVSPSGATTVIILSNNRSSISYNGTVMPLRRQ